MTYAVDGNRSASGYASGLTDSPMTEYAPSVSANSLAIRWLIPRRHHPPRKSCHLRGAQLFRSYSDNDRPGVLGEQIPDDTASRRPDLRTLPGAGRQPQPDRAWLW